GGRKSLNLNSACRTVIETEASTEILVREAAGRHLPLATTGPRRAAQLTAPIGTLHQSDARFLFATWKEPDWHARSDTGRRVTLKSVPRRDRAPLLLEAHVREAGEALVERVRIECRAWIYEGNRRNSKESGRS